MLAAAISMVGGGATAYTLSPVARPRVAMRSASVVMAEEIDMVKTVPWGDEREGKPFGGADRDASYDANKSRQLGGIRESTEAYQPRAISDATVPKPQYIESDDEPWHSTCRSTTVITKSNLESSFTTTLPFVAAEDALLDATRAAKSADEVKKAIETAKGAGARSGCPAIVAAEKVVKAFAKGDDEAVAKAKPKAPKAGAQGKGWDGMARGVAKVHDNSVA